MTSSHTSLISGRMAKDERSTKKSRKATARLMEALENRTLLSTDPTNWLSAPTAEWRQPATTSSTTVAQQVQLQGFPQATVYTDGALQYTDTWMGNSYGGYPVTAPDGGTLDYNLVQMASRGVAAGPIPTGQAYALMAMNCPYTEEGNALSIYENGAALSTNASSGGGGGRGVAFGGNYVFQSFQNGGSSSGIIYDSVARFNLDGTPANFTSGPLAGQNCFGINTISGETNYIYSYVPPSSGLQPPAIAYNTSTHQLYVTDPVDNAVYIFNADTGAAISTPNVNGVALNTVGNGQTITVSDGSLTSAVTPNINVVTNGTQTSSLVPTTTDNATAGTAFSITLKAYKADGITLDTSYAGTVHFTSTDSQAQIYNGTSWVSLSSYAPSFTAGSLTLTNGLTLKTAGNQTITAVDTTNGLNITTPTIVVAPSSTCSSLVFDPVSSVSSPSVAISSGFNLTLRAKDPYGNICTAYRGTVHFTSTDGSWTAPSDRTFTSGDAGVYTTGNIKFGTTSGTGYTVTATDTGNGSLVISTPLIKAVATTTAKQFGISSVPTNATAGTAFSITVTAQKANGTTVTGYVGTVHLSSTDGIAGLPADYTFTAGESGVHTFTNLITLKTAGSQTVTVTDTNNNLIVGTTTAIVVAPGTPNKLVATTSLSTYSTCVVAAGAPFSVTVKAEDQYNNIITNYTSSVSFSTAHTSTDYLPTHYANYTFTSLDNGVHTFANGCFPFANAYDVAIDNSGNVWLTNRTTDPITNVDYGDGKVYEYNSLGVYQATPITGLTASDGGASAKTGPLSIAWNPSTSTFQPNTLVVARGGRVDATAYPILYYSGGSQVAHLGTSLFASSGHTPGEVTTPSTLSFINDIDVDSAGYVYVDVEGQVNWQVDVRVLNPSTGALVYAEEGSHAATAVATTNPISGQDYMYSQSSIFKMNYSAAPGDQWTLMANTVDPLYTADTRIASQKNNPVCTAHIVYLNNTTYMYLVGANNYLEVYKQDTGPSGSDIFRPVVVISLDNTGNPTSNGFPFNIPAGDLNKMWIWTDGAVDNSGTANGCAEGNEYVPSTKSTWNQSLVAPSIDANGDIFFNVTHTDGTNNTGPGIVELRIDTALGTNGFNNAGVPIYSLDSTYTTAIAAPADAAWGSGNAAEQVAYDASANVLYIAGGPNVSGFNSNGYTRGNGTILRAYNWNNTTPSSNNLSSGWTWSISPSWVTQKGTNWMRTMASAGDTNSGYLFVEARGQTDYVYNRADGTLVGQMYQLPVDSHHTDPDDPSQFTAFKRADGSYVVVTPNFYVGNYDYIMAPGNRVPTASFSQDIVSSTSSSPITVNFSATASDLDGDTLSYAWQFGDGTFDRTSGPTVSHTYTHNGAFAVSLVVTDGKGGVADAASTVSFFGTLSAPTSITGSALDCEINDVGSQGVASSVDVTGTTALVGGNSGASKNVSDVFPFDLWGAGLMPGDQLSTTANLPNISVVATSTRTPSPVDLYAVGMCNTIDANTQDIGNLYYAGTGDTTPGAVLLKSNFIAGTMTNGTVTLGSGDTAAKQALAQYINAALAAGNRYILFRLSPQNKTAGDFYTVYTAEEGAINGAYVPKLTLTPLARATVTNSTSYNVLNGVLAQGLSQYSDNSATFNTVPAKYLDMTYLRTANGDAASSTGTLPFTVNQASTVYVLYDDALVAHKPNWLGASYFTDTNDNIVTTAGTFSVYKNNADTPAGISTVTLGANTSDGYTGGHMYSVVLAPSLPTGLVGQWQFGQVTGTSAADSAGTHTGTVSGPVVYGSGYLGNTEQFADNQPGAPGNPNPAAMGTCGNALYFNGQNNATGNYVTISDSGDLHPANMTVSLWARNDIFEQPNTTPNGWNGLVTGPNGDVYEAPKSMYLIYKSGSFYIQTVASGLPEGAGDTQTLTFNAYIGGVLKTITYTPPQNTNNSAPANNFSVFQWHQYGMTYDGSTLRAYVDGTQVGTPISVSGSLAGNSNAVIIGGSEGTTASLFKGYIDDVRIYSAAKSASDMQALGDLGAGISTVSGTATPVGATTGLTVTGLTPAVLQTTSFTVSAPGSATAGSAFSVTVTAKDSTGATATGYTGTVHFATSDTNQSGQNILPSDYTFLASENGVHTFTNGVKLTTAGTQTVTVTSTVNGTITGTSSNITVNAAAASTLNVSAPGSIAAGTAFSVTVTAKDAYGNTATGYAGTVHFTSSDGAANLPANYTFVSGDQGVHTFTNGVTLNTAGNQTVTATDTVTGTITGTSGTINVTVATSVSIVETSNATEGGGNGVFTVTRTGSTGSALTVNYSIGGSAVNGTDYTSLPGTVTIASGSSTATITVAATNDTVAELTETVDLTITSGTGYNIGSPNYATVNIVDNDSVGYLDSSNLVGYWRLDENSGTNVYDTAPGGSTADNGTAPASWGTGKIGNAYHAQSSGNDVITVNNSSDLTTGYVTVAAWAKGDTGPSWASSLGSIINRDNGIRIIPGTSKQVKFEVYVGGWKIVTATGPSDVSTWHYYVMTYDGSTLKTYIDNVSAGTLAVSGTVNSNSNSLYIGGTSTSAAFVGMVDEVRIYNTALNTTDLTSLYNGSALSVTGLTVAGSHGASYSINANALQTSVTLYGDAANTFSTIPGKYLGSTLLKTANADAATTGDKQLGFTLNQNSIVYVLYDDAITGSHRASWLAAGNGFTDTGDNITDSSGHTFSVYKASVSAGTLWLGGNTADGVNGTGLMYDVLIQPLL